MNPTPESLPPMPELSAIEWPTVVKRAKDWGLACYAAGAAEERVKMQAEIARLRAALDDWLYANGPDGWIEELRKKVESSAAARAEPTDPLDAPIPADFTAAGATFRKGLPMRLIAKRIERLWEAAYGPMPTPEEQAANLARLQGAVSPQPLAEPRAEPAMLDPDSDDAQGLAAPEGYWHGFKACEDTLGPRILELQAEVDALESRAPTGVEAQERHE